MAENPWFRLYSEFATDPKVQMLSEANQRRYIMLLCLRCSNGDETLQDEEVAFQLRISNEEWAATKAVFVSKGLTLEDNSPAAWDKRQYRSDSSAERVRKHRENKKRACNVTATAPDTDTDTEVNPKTKTPKPPTPYKPARFDPFSIDLPDCIPREAWERWIAYRRARKLTTAEQTAKGQAAKLAEWHKAGHDPTAIIDASISNGWQGLFEPKNGKGNERYDDKLQRTADALTGRNRRPAGGEVGRTLDGEARAVD